MNGGDPEYSGPFRREDDHSSCPNPGCREPDRAARAAVKEILFICGGKVDAPESVAEFQSDLRFGREVRVLIKRGILGFVAALCALIGGYLWTKIVGS